jgi:hypothetical protein
METERRPTAFCKIKSKKMEIDITNSLKKQEGWYQSFSILPVASIYKNCDTNRYSFFLSWLFISIGFHFKTKS